MRRFAAFFALCALLAACGGEDAHVDGETAASPTIDSAAAATTPVADSVTDTAAP